MINSAATKDRLYGALKDAIPRKWIIIMWGVSSSLEYVGILLIFPSIIYRITNNCKTYGIDINCQCRISNNCHKSNRVQQKKKNKWCLSLSLLIRMVVTRQCVKSIALLLGSIYRMYSSVGIKLLVLLRLNDLKNRCNSESWRKVHARRKIHLLR